MPNSSAKSLLNAVIFDVQADEETQDRLKEPLLPSSSTAADKDESPSEPSDSVLFPMKLLTFSSGSFMALLSQFILKQTLWSEDVLEQGSTSQAIWYTFVWSAWTCPMFYAALAILLKMSRSQELDARESEMLDFQTKSHFIVGALLAISLSWIFVDVMRATLPMTAMHYIAFFFVNMAFYRSFLFIMVTRFPNDPVLMPTYHLLSSCLGLIMGLCSQFLFLLSVALWRNHLTEPAIDNMVVFSLVWIVATVGLVYGACMTLRVLSAEDGARPRDTAKIQLRMEAYYLFSSLIGICMAWVLIHLILNEPEQIVPSVAMLGVALLAFCGILSLFPEEECLEEYDDEDNKAAEIAISVV